MAALSDREAIDLANERVDIVKACTLIEMDVPDFDVGSAKVYCPFGEMYHPDGGSSRSFRLYPGKNSAFCFAGCGYFNPVMLVSQARGLSERGAADYLLELSGYVAPDPSSRWEALMSAPLVFDHAAESEALKLFCARIDPKWNDRQFDPKIASLLTRCFSPLGKVSSQEELRLWRETVRNVMAKALTHQLQQER